MYWKYWKNETASASCIHHFLSSTSNNNSDKNSFRSFLTRTPVLVCVGSRKEKTNGLNIRHLASYFRLKKANFHVKPTTMFTDIYRQYCWRPLLLQTSSAFVLNPNRFLRIPSASVSLPAFEKKEKIHFRAAWRMFKFSLNEGHMQQFFNPQRRSFPNHLWSALGMALRVGDFLRLVFLWVSPSPAVLAIP